MGRKKHSAGGSETNGKTCKLFFISSLQLTIYNPISSWRFRFWRFRFTRLCLFYWWLFLRLYRRHLYFCLLDCFTTRHNSAFLPFFTSTSHFFLFFWLLLHRPRADNDDTHATFLFFAADRKCKTLIFLNFDSFSLSRCVLSRDASCCSLTFQLLYD